ncbi:MAG: DUF2130 domain-containing protein [Solirubrobacteraceae bacterium]
MEAATPLPFTQIRVVGDSVRVDGLTIRDECAVRLISEADEPGKVIADAIEIGARVLDREQTGANAEFVKAEFEKAASELNTQFVDRARTVAEGMNTVITRHFNDESSDAVQHKVRQIVRDVSAEMQKELRNELLSEDEGNPLAKFHRIQLALSAQQAKAQAGQMQALNDKLEEYRLELERLRAQNEKLEEVAAVEEKGTAKGRTYEEEVALAVDAVALPQGDVADAVGDHKESTGKKGDVVVSIDACNGPARGRIVFEAKNARMTRPKALEELDLAMAERNADYGILVVPSDEKVPAKMQALREYNGDKMIVAYDPDDGPLGLQVAYSLARARVLMARGGDEGVDIAAVRDTIERAVGAMEDVRRIKQQLTGATTQIKTAADIVTTMSDRVKGYLADVNELLAAADAEAVPEETVAAPAPFAGGDAGLFDAA